MRFVKLKESAILPKRGTKLSAGYDLVAAEDCVILSGESELVSTGIGWTVEDDSDLNKVGLIWPRSSLAVKHGIEVQAGVIDADYQDEIKVLLFANDIEPFTINKGDRIAQLIIQTFGTVSDDEFTQEARHGGFGSTGS